LGAEQEDRYLKSLWIKLSEIQTNPESGRMRADLAINCRSVRYGKHLIFFLVEGQSLQIIRILHSAMDLNTRLEAEE
jgi:toxin ParE1/3/4